MSSDVNGGNTNYLKQGYQIQHETRKVNIDGTAIKKTFKNIGKVFEFFTSTKEEPEEIMFKDYENEINKYEMNYAITQKILNDSDPSAKKKINIVI